jgi:hypothetical protein
MLDFQLFRIKVFPPAQSSLFEVDATPQGILVQTIKSLPEAEFRTGKTWHVGNVTEVDQDSLYFRIGRTSKATIEVYDNGRFLDQEFDTSPYTHIFLEIELEVCAIASKRKLARTTDRMARQLAKLLNRSNRAREFGAKFEINMINDPEDFISRLKSAYSVEKFWLTFTRPNSIDVEEDYIKPMERLLSAATGDRGKTEIKGPDLDDDVLEQLSRSAASTGDNAGASIRHAPEERALSISLKGRAVDIAQDSVDGDDEKRSFIQRLRERYEGIRDRISSRDE